MAPLLAGGRLPSTLAIAGMATWMEPLARWSAYLAACGFSERTIQSYRRYFGNFLMDTLLDPRAVTEDDVTTYLRGKNWRGAHRAMLLKAMRSFYTWAEPRKVVKRNPVRWITPKERHYGPAPSLDEEALVRLLIALAWRDERRAWTVLLAYETGARIGSLVDVCPEDVQGGYIRFRTAKGGRPYSVPLNATAQEAARMLVNGRPTLIGVSAQAVRQWMAQASADSGLHVWPHLLRHTFAVHLVEAGVGAEVVKELLNHRSLATTQRYFTVRDERKRLAVATLDR